RVRLRSSLAMWLGIADRLTNAADVLTRLRGEFGPELDPIAQIMASEAEFHHDILAGSPRVLHTVKPGLAVAQSQGTYFETTYLLATAMACATVGEAEDAALYLDRANEAASRSSHMFRGGFLQFVQGHERFGAGDFVGAVQRLDVPLQRGDLQRSGN